MQNQQQYLPDSLRVATILSEEMDPQITDHMLSPLILQRYAGTCWCVLLPKTTLALFSWAWPCSHSYGLSNLPFDTLCRSIAPGYTRKP